MAFNLFDMTRMNSCFCDSLTSKLLFMWYFSYFIHPLYPSQWGRRLKVFVEMILNLCNGINWHVFISSKMHPLPLVPSIRKTAGYIHVPKRVQSQVVLCYWMKNIVISLITVQIFNMPFQRSPLCFQNLSLVSFN